MKILSGKISKSKMKIVKISVRLPKLPTELENGSQTQVTEARVIQVLGDRS